MTILKRFDAGPAGSDKERRNLFAEPRTDLLRYPIPEQKQRTLTVILSDRKEIFVDLSGLPLNDGNFRPGASLVVGPLDSGKPLRPQLERIVREGLRRRVLLKEESELPRPVFAQQVIDRQLYDRWPQAAQAILSQNEAELKRLCPLEEKP